MAWIVRLVKTGADGEKQCADVLKINRPDDLGNIANLGLTLAEGKLLLAGLVVVLAGMGLPWVPAGDRALFVALLVAQICESFSEYYTLGFRVKGHFSRETARVFS